MKLNSTTIPLQLRLTPAALHTLRRRVSKARDTELLQRSDEDLALLLSACDVALEGVSEDLDGVAKARRRIENFLLDEIDSDPLDLAGVVQIVDALDLDWSLHDRGALLSVDVGPWHVVVKCVAESSTCHRGGVAAVVRRYEQRADEPHTDTYTYTWTEAQHAIDGLTILAE